MTDKRKVFQKGDLKKYAKIAGVLLASMAQGLSAQTFDVSKASEKDKVLYESMVEVLSIKLETDSAANLAGEIMIDSQKLDGDEAKKFIRAKVEMGMGDEYAENMASARQQAGVEDINAPEVVKYSEAKIAAATAEKTDTISAVSTPTVEKTDTIAEQNSAPLDGASVKVTKDGNMTRTDTSVNKTIHYYALSPEEKAKYDMIAAKIKTAAELNGQKESNLSRQRNSTYTASVYAHPEELREGILKQYTKGVLFRDVDAKSFVAYSEKTGEGKIVAPTEKAEKEIRKQVKKAGGMANFVKEGQKKEVKQTNLPQRNTVNFSQIEL